jgi:hypothetical protein
MPRSNTSRQVFPDRSLSQSRHGSKTSVGPLCRLSLRERRPRSNPGSCYPRSTLSEPCPNRPHLEEIHALPKIVTGGRGTRPADADHSNGHEMADTSRRASADARADHCRVAELSPRERDALWFPLSPARHGALSSDRHDLRLRPARPGFWRRWTSPWAAFCASRLRLPRLGQAGGWQ